MKGITTSPPPPGSGGGDDTGSQVNSDVTPRGGPSKAGSSSIVTSPQSPTAKTRKASRILSPTSDTSADEKYIDYKGRAKPIVLLCYNTGCIAVGFNYWFCFAEFAAMLQQ